MCLKKREREFEITILSEVKWSITSMSREGIALYIMVIIDVKMVNQYYKLHRVVDIFYEGKKEETG